ncbi:flavodoxin [Agilicoccus flavus]|uniref:flavodoxin n=1 Tax=Agilicoccus flavus TaxID=2775968 RepID=UPI001CF61290|nr:flavodoxin [Agilicoccus flavus]
MPVTRVGAALEWTDDSHLAVDGALVTGGLDRRALLVGAAGVVAAALAGCATPPTAGTDPSPRSAGMTTGPDPGSSSRPARVLLAFFSRAGESYHEGGRRNLAVGNTKVLAGMIADRVDCDVHEIVAADPYPEAYDPTVARNSAEQERDARPAIANPPPDVRGYDAVLIGSPVWNVRAPMIMSTFIESVDLAGTTILPFVTYAVSGMSGIDDDYRRALPGCDVRAGLAVRGETVRDAATDLEAWLAANRLGRAGRTDIA